MVIVHRLNNSEFIINANHIETIESTPDTVITLNNEKKYIVKETASEVIERIVSYYKKIYQLPIEYLNKGEKS